MRSLEEIVAANSQAVARHNPEWLSNIWPIGQAVYALPTEEPLPTAKSTITFGVEALLDMARYALGYNFKGLEQGLINVLRAERGIPAGEPVPVDALTMFAFSLGASTDLVDEWVSALSDAVAPYAERTGSFVIRDAEHKVIITVEDRVVTRVEPMKRRLR